MSENSKVGKIGWIDMTVDDAEGVRDFYKHVVGWGSEDVDASAAACTANGGEVLVKPRGLAGGRFCVIRDLSGATAALYQP